MPTDVTRYSLSQSARAQAVGTLAVLTGGGVLAAVGLELAGESASVHTASWIAVGLSVLLAVALLVAVVRLVRPPTVLELADEGYRVRSLRGIGVRQAAWRDVRDVVTGTQGDQQIVLIRLRDGDRTTSLPVRLVGAPPAQWLADLDRRLDAAHGQRRLT